jgi:transaldolase
MRVAVAADHAGMPLRDSVVEAVRASGAEPVILLLPNAGPDDDYPDAARLVGRAIASGAVTRGVVVCGSGAGVAIAASRLPLVRAATAHDTYTAHQMVEHDDANVLAIGARIVGTAVVDELVRAFVGASFATEARHARRLAEVLALHASPPNGPRQLHEAGQSLWLDNINKSLLETGTLAYYIEELAVTGLTSNPSILAHALSAHSGYDDAIRRYLGEGLTSPEDLALALSLEDLRTAADLFRPNFDASEGFDGLVSVEVPPGLADAAEETIAFAGRLVREADRPNVLVKVPGTQAGLTAVEELIARGVGVNVTLLFSPAHYIAAAEAYLRGLERRAAKGESLAVPSVASIFVSRWDVAANPLLPRRLHEKLGVATTEMVYAAYSDLCASERFQSLKRLGARPQRVLWASTSTKDPEFSDTYYLGRLVAPGTIDTVPEQTLLAFAEHGKVGDLVRPDREAAEQVLAEVAAEGIDLDGLAASLQREGLASFVGDWSALLSSMQAKISALSS